MCRNFLIHLDTVPQHLTTTPPHPPGAYPTHEKRGPDQQLLHPLLGTNLYADRIFTGSILQSIYHFHGSASAFAAFWKVVLGKKNNVESSGFTMLFKPRFLMNEIRLCEHDAPTAACRYSRFTVKLVTF